MPATRLQREVKEYALYGTCLSRGEAIHPVWNAMSTNQNRRHNAGASLM